MLFRIIIPTQRVRYLIFYIYNQRVRTIDCGTVIYSSHRGLFLLETVVSNKQPVRVISITEIDRLLRIKAEKNRRRPKFRRAEYHRLKRIQTSWRSPKGIDSKMRKKLKGKRPSPSTGYRNPRKVRGFHPSGKEVVRVFNIFDLEDVNPETQIAQIGSTVGTRKRIAIINQAEELEIHIINPQIRREFDDIDDIGADVELIEDEDILLEDDDTILLDEEETSDNEEDNNL